MSGIDAHGVRLRRWRESSGAYEDIANVTSIEGPGIERQALDVTAHDTEGNYMEFVPGLVDPGEVEIEVNYDPLQHDALVADFDDDEPRNYRLVFPDPDATTWEFQAFITGFTPKAPYDDKLTTSLTFKVTGRPALGVADGWPSAALYPALDLYPSTGD